MRDMSRVFQDMDYPVANAYAKQLGITEDLLNAMRSPAFAEMYDQQKKIAEASDSAAAAGQRFSVKLRGLQSRVSAVGDVIGEKLIDVLGPHVDEATQWFEDNADTISDLVAGIAQAIVNASRIIMPIINKIIEGWRLLIQVSKEGFEEFKTWANSKISVEVGDAIGSSTESVFKWLGIKDVVDDMLGLNGGSGSGKGPDPMAFFQSLGWTREQAAGIVANLQRESQMDPKAIGDNGKAVGIAQWHPDRQANFRRWAGKDLKDASVEEQMRFVHYELTQGAERNAGNLLKAAKNAEQAGRIVSLNYERPANAEYEASRRGAAAAQIAQTTTIQVIGAGDPVATANRVADAQTRVNQDMVRNFTPVLN